MIAVRYALKIGQEAHMTPDETSASESIGKPTLSADARPMWTGPKITRVEVTRTLAGSGIYSDAPFVSNPRNT